MKRFFLAVSLVAASTSGCNSLADIKPPLDKDPEGTAPVGDAGASGVTFEDFLGTWSTSNAVQSITQCSFAASGTVPEQKLILAAGPGSGTLFSSPGVAPGCRIQSRVQGSTATVTADPPQVCQFTFPDGHTETYAYTAATFTITSPGKANVRIAAEVLVQPAGEVCLFEENAVYTKL